MDKKQMTHFSEKLEKMSNDILSGADKTISEMTDHSDNYPDPTDRAAAESDRSFELRIRDRERKLLNKIKEASERIENGTYGICDECGDDIASDRLEARPVTTYCIDCKTRQEQEEKSKA
jgi:DnaK suppressor protein